jgi:hypothetical protein
MTASAEIAEEACSPPLLFVDASQTTERFFIQLRSPADQDVLRPNPVFRMPYAGPTTALQM